MWQCWAESITKMFCDHSNSLIKTDYEKLIRQVGIWCSDGRIDSQKLKLISQLPLTGKTTLVTEHFVCTK